MNNYILLEITCEFDLIETLIAELGACGFEGFIENDLGFEAYIPESELNELSMNYVFEHYHIDSKNIVRKIMAQQNWNAAWESSFEPVVIDNLLIIKAPFHQLDKLYPYELIIQPKTSFGTGHHETTYLIMKLMLQMDFKNKVVFDYGSGTGILAILASKLGATSVFANDIDEWAAENIIENATLNAIQNIEFVKGDLTIVAHKKFDCILANINKNILTASFEGLSKILTPKASLFISGFYENDLEDLLAVSATFGLKLVHKEVLNSWCTAELKN